MFFPGSVSPYAFNELVTRQWNKYYAGVSQSVYQGFALFDQYKNDPTQYARIQSLF